ncbi:MAG: DNA gyrase/topoisomerase IV subunit A [Saprospiraceae bacterium]|nr:DNA gyrase/topoisomerase IV subunit A [Saprospiraceae bacterium]
MSKEKFKPEIEHKDPEGLPTLTGMYQEYFLDYASYVILERAVPHINDGLKPVQRRILHAMKEMDDGRFHKVANIIGQTMQFHPHGDAAIGDALVNLGQKDLLIDCQGNWGDIRTGDSAAAPRYIEARLTKFALDVAFNAQTTHWQLSYDGRKKEPITLPMKFPLVLAQGVEGIAVGLATKILPHNFIELIKASIKVLQGKKATIYPDFQTGGMIDVSEYNDGLRGGRVKVRAKIEQVDKSTLMITQLPYGVTTTSMIESIIKATEKGQIKVKKVVDNTAKNVEIVMDLIPGTSPDITIDALYAFTECEVSISPNACVIVDDKPRFLGVSELLRISTEQTKALLEWELNIKKSELEEKWHLASLEKIFIENRIYHDIEESETWESVIETIDAGLRKYVVTPSEKAKASDKRLRLMRELTEEDITKLTEIRIKRISKYNSFKADEYIQGVEQDLKQVAFDLENLTDYAIAYFERLLEKYGKGKERKTEITSIEQIQVQQVVANNAKLYVNLKDGFVGMGMKKDDFVCDCSDIDDVIAFTRDGKFKVVRIADKVFVGKDIIHVAVWKKGDERTTYNLVYVDGKTGTTYAKRFNVTGITRDKEYDLTKDGSKGSKVLYFTMQPNGESEVLNITLTPASTARIKVFDYDLSEIAIKGRSSQGNIVTKYPVRKVTQVSVGQSSLGAMKVYIDDVSGRLNTDGRGRLLGAFDTGEKLIALYKDGSYELSELDLTRKFDVNAIEMLSQYTEDMVIGAIYYEGEKGWTMVKRFKIETNSLAQKFYFIPEGITSKLYFATTHTGSKIKITYKNGGQKEEYEFMLDEFIDVKGWKALGNKLFEGKMMKVEELSYDQPAEPQDHSPVQGDLFGGKGGDKGGKLKSGDTVEW